MVSIHMRVIDIIAGSGTDDVMHIWRNCHAFLWSRDLPFWRRTERRPLIEGEVDLSVEKEVESVEEAVLNLGHELGRQVGLRSAEERRSGQCPTALS